MQKHSFVSRVFASAVLGCASLLLASPASAALTVTPLTWNIVGLDSNTPLSGPEFFPVGARVCSTTATSNVTVDFVWDSVNPFVNLRPGSLAQIVFPNIAAGACVDAYYEVAVTKNPAAFDTTRRYHIEATDLTGTASTPVPRELYVEHLVSQARNSITNVLFGPAGGTLTSVPPGGSMNLVVGNEYDIRLEGGTATGGYEQFAAFINFSNAIFRIIDVDTTLSVVAPPRVVSPNDRLYADACLWDNDPGSPTYRACLSTGKAGGTIVTTVYRIRIVSGGGTAETLNTLLYDFSGSSFHYNADYGVGARVANIINPASAGISKAFAPSTTSVGGVAKLNITLTNPNAGALSGYSFTDNLPANMTIANPAGLTTTGCGTPSVTAVAGGSSIVFSNGTVAANSSCVISVNVTPSATGALLNTTSNLFVGTVDTGNTASATLTVNNTPPPPACLPGQTLATWTFPIGSNALSPAPTVANVTASANAGAGLTPSIQNDTVVAGTGSWASDNISQGALVTANNEYFEFLLNTTGFESVSVSFQAKRSTQGPDTLQLFAGTTAPGTASSIYTIGTAFSAFGPTLVNAGLNSNGNTLFRLYASNASQNNNGHFIFVDAVTFTGCGQPVQPTLTKAFAPTVIGVGAAGTSTLSFTISNANNVPLTNAAFDDPLPAGLQVAAVPAATNTCGGTWLPLAGATTIALSGGTVSAAGSCTLSVAVTATSAGPKFNTSGSISTTETGINIGPTGSASATLTAILPPTLEKTFAPSPILPNGVSTLTFVLVNPNPGHALAGVAFGDTFPVAPGAMVVATTPNASTAGCGAPTYAPAAGAGSISFSNGSIAPGAVCTVRVNVTAPAIGSYANISGNVSHVVAGTTFTGSNSSDTLVVNPPNPSVTLLKEVGTTPTGPWLPYLATTAGANVFYRITVENTGDVLLNPLAVSDPQFPSLASQCSFPPALPVADANDDDHLAICVFDTVTPIVAIAGSNDNTATANATGASVAVSDSDTAIYATTGLSLVKSANPMVYNAAGEPIAYSFLVTNSGAAILAGPVTITDPLLTVTCPALTTVGDLDAFFDPGESITCSAPYTTTPADVAAGSVTNTATASAGGVTSPPSSVTITTPQSADVSLDKLLLTPGPHAPGATVTFQITISNAGPNAASNLSLTDNDVNLTVTNVSSASMSCAGGAFPCTLASLASGASATVTVTATIDAIGAFSNSASVTSTTPDPNPGNESDTDGGTASSADLQLSKTLDTLGPFIPGQSVTFTVTVTNAGPSTADNVSVSDVDSNLTVTNVTSAVFSCAGGNAFPCTVASLANGASGSLTVTATIDAAGAFSNTATVSSTTPDPAPGNNSATDGEGVTSANLALVKTLDSVGPFAPGQAVAYTITVSNNGPDTAVNVSVGDTDNNLTVTGVSSAMLTCIGNTFPCTIASLPNGASVTISVSATIDAAGPFSNTATVTSDTPDPVPGNESDTDGDTAASADLSLSKTLTTLGPYTIGQAVSFDILVTNAGPSTATNVQVTDTPSNLTITNVSGSGCVALPCTIASLANGASTTITVTATISTEGAFGNSATVSSDTFDPDPSDDTGSDSDNTTPSANLSLSKTLTTAGPFVVGQSVSFEIVVNNAGPSTALNVQIADTPANFTITNVSGAGCLALPCTLPSLASGANATITVTGTVPADGAFGNSATVTSTTGDPDPGDNTDTDTGSATPSADLSLVKTLTTPGPYSVGQSVSFDIVISNAGPSAASNVAVTDTPNNITITNVSGAGCAALPCLVPSIASGSSATITVTATINSDGAFGNTASVTSDTSDPDPSDNTDTDTDSTLPGANLSVVKTLTTAGPYSVGQTLSFDIVVANAGPSTATNVQLTDTPSNLTLVSVSGGGCAALPCTIPSLASGASATITVTATIGGDGAFGNTATVTSSVTDPDPGDNTDTETGNTTPSADLSLVKTLTTAGPYSVGQSVSFSIVVSNAGPSTANGVQVTDTPSNLTITAVSGAGCAALPCTLPSLGSGASATINVTATINAEGAFGNTATVTSTTTDPDPGDNTDTDTGSTTPSADVSVVKTLTTAGPYSVGQLVSFSIVVSNAGPSAASGVQVTDTPSNLSITSVSGAGCAALPCTLASLASGASATITVTATINAQGAFGNSATATSSTPDPDPGDNTDIDTGSTLPSADVSILKTVNTLSPTIGSTVTFTLAIANAGPSSAVAVQVADVLPAGYTFVAATPSVGSYNSGTGVWTVGTLVSGGSATMGLQATVNAAGPYANTATVSSSTPDPDPGDNVSTSTPTPITPIGNADLAVLKTGPAQIERGQQVTFTIRVENRGPDAAINARLLDPTPVGLTFVSTSGACTGPFPCALGNMASGEVRMLTATYLVPSNYAGPNMIVNVVTAASDSADPTPGDSSSSSSVLVPAGQPNLAVPQVIPVDARWALLLLGALMLLVARRGFSPR